MGFEPILSRLSTVSLYQLAYVGVVLMRGIEPPLPEYETGVLPLALHQHIWSEWEESNPVGERTSSSYHISATQVMIPSVLTITLHSHIIVIGLPWVELHHFRPNGFFTV